MFHQIFCVLSLLIYQAFNKTLPRCVASQKKSLLMSSNGVSLNSKKGLVIVLHVFKVEGI